jgi:cation diffusion facilitator family transporter
MLRARRVRRALVLEGISDALMLAGKLAVGLHVGSVAILSDALHSLTDLANNVVALLALRLSTAPPDREHPYGHRKFETLAVFGLATLLTVTAIEIVLRALGRADDAVDRSGWGLAVMLSVFGVNIGIAAWQGYQARVLDSDLLRADARHTLSDVLVTAMVIGGWQVAAAGHWWVDPLLALVVAGVVFYLAFGLFRRAIPVLVDQIASDPTELIDAVRSVPGVREIRRVRSRASGEGVAADVVVSVDATLSTEESHRVANDIEAALEHRLGIADVTVHIEPSKG